MPKVNYVAARAEALPFGEATFGAAWLSTVIHHIPDLEECAHQLRRVLLPGAAVLIRSAFGDRLEGITLLRYFPEAKKVAGSFPTVEQTQRAFASAGFAFKSVHSVPQVSARSLEEFYVGLLALRLADSTMRAMSDESFQRGRGLVKTDLDSGNTAPVVDLLDLMVLRRL